jgi:indolepyruvate ferredoxin oxidoreductase beta subunit
VDGNDFLADRGFDVMPVPATTRAIELGNHKVANVIMLGALATRLDLPQSAWDDTLEARIPAQLLALNRDAFAAGRDAVASPA